LTDKSNWIPGASDACPTSAPYARGVVQEMPTRGAGDARGVVHHVPTKNTNKNTSKNTREESAREALVISQETTPARPHTPQVEDAVSIAVSFFPQMGIWQQELIANADISKLHIWRQVMQIWRDHKHSRNNIHGMIDKYNRFETQDIRDKEYQNGKNANGHKRESHNERAARETIEYIERLTGTSIRDSDAHPADTIFKLPAAFGGK
jgi:hypothetical protein